MGVNVKASSAGRSSGDIPGLDLAEQRTWEQFLEASLLLRATVSKDLDAAHQLPLLDLRLLLFLERSGRPLRMGELADSLLVPPSRITRQVRRLENARLVERVPSTDDGRAVLAAITVGGREALSKAVVTYGQSLRWHFLSRLSRPQLAAIGESCRRITGGLREPRPAGRPRRP